MEIPSHILGVSEKSYIIENLPSSVNILGTGSGRVVVEDDDCVIKIATRGCGLRQNKTEVDIWNTIQNSNVSEYFATVHDSHTNFWTIKMDKVVINEESQKRFIDSTADEIHSKLHKYDIELYELEYGYIHNSPVAYDYGCKL